MLIGGDFNKKSEQLLVAAGKLSGNKPEEKISVSDVNKILHYDRNEMKNYLEYLNDRNLVILHSIGGPMLYGHISITKKGLAKIKDIEKR